MCAAARFIEGKVTDTPKAILSSIWPAEIIDILTRAAKVSAAKPSSYYGTFFKLEGQTSIGVNLQRVAMLPPDTKSDLMQLDIAQAPSAYQAIDIVRGVHAEFEVVREIVAWLEKNTGPAAARELFPPLLALLPERHTIHAVKGLRTPSPKTSPNAMLEKFRSGAATVTTALLLPPLDLLAPTDWFFRTTFYGIRPWKDQFEQGYSSSYFTIA
jgi:hypothetical protein